MRYSLVRTTPPAQLPVSMQELRDHLSLADDEQHYDQQIRRLAAAAVEAVEAETGRQLLTATWRLTLDVLPYGQRPIIVPRPPLQSVSSITIDGAAYTSHTVDTGFPGRILPPSTGWPNVDADYNGVVITFVCGETTTATVPEACKHAILLLVGNWFRNREAVLTGTIATELPLAVKYLLATASAGDEFVTIGGQAWYDR